MNKQLLDILLEKARGKVKCIAFPEAEEEKILKAAKAVSDTGAIKAVLVGDAEKIKAAALLFDVDLSNMRMMDNTDETLRSNVSERYSLQNGLLSLSSIKRKCKDPMNFAFILEALGDVDAVFAGLVHTTGEVILAAQTFIGLMDGISTVSSMGIMDIQGYSGVHGTLLAFADAAVSVAPTSEELADIAISTCDTVRSLLEWEPRCALLSYSSDGSAEHESVEKVRKAVGLANAKRPDLLIDGEFQLDTALLKETARKKVKRESSVAGNADIIIYPDINAGNIAVKTVQIFAHGDCYGPMLQGFKKPVSDCSRSAPINELIGNIIMLAARA